MKTAPTFTYREFMKPYVILFFIAICLVLTSCYPYDSIEVNEADTVLTFRNASTDFSTKQTYAMPDSVEYRPEDDATPDPDPVVEQQILSTIERNMEEAGFDKVPAPDEADVLVVPVVTTTTYQGGGCYYWYWDYWYGYPGYCDPYYYEYDVGTLLIIMVDPALAADPSRKDALWIAGINGLLSSSVETAARINKNVNQAFAQSPYLSDGK